MQFHCWYSHHMQNTTVTLSAFNCTSNYKQKEKIQIKKKNHLKYTLFGISMALPVLAGTYKNSFQRAFICWHALLVDTALVLAETNWIDLLLLTINTGWPCSCCTGNLSFFTCTASCLSSYSPSGLTAISVQSNNLTCTCSQLTWKKNQQQVPESLNALQAIYYSRRESWPYVTTDTQQ